MPQNTLTDPQYWKAQTSNFRPHVVTAHEFDPVLRRLLPSGTDLTCVEVGAYPGDFLCYLARTFGYQATAIEFRDDADNIRRLFEYNEVPGPQIINADFLQLKGLQFDVVSSIGFVEHFIDYEHVIDLHVEMLKPGGYLALAVPHLWGLQGLLRRVFLTDQALKEIRTTHNARVMQLGEIVRILGKHGLNIEFADYVMGASWWIAPDSPRIRLSMRTLARVLTRLDGRILRKLPSSFLYSPMILCVAKRAAA